MIEFSRTLKEASWLYRFCRYFCLVHFRFFWRLQIFHETRVPPHGPLIVCANHRSFADPPIVAVSLKRPVHFLAKEELFLFKPFGWLISRLNAHPLNRSGDVSAFKMAIRVLKHGGIMIIFPEGGRSRTEVFRPAKAGVGLLAHKTGVPILPVYIHNSGYWLRGKALKVVIGNPLDPSAFKDYREIGPAVLSEIKKLKEEYLAR